MQQDLTSEIVFQKQIKIRELASELRELIRDIEGNDEKIETLNYVRSELHEVSPFKASPG